MAETEKWLDKLADPNDKSGRWHEGSLLYAIRLFHAVNKDTSSLRGLIVREVLPFLRGGIAAAAHPSMKFQLIECYLEAFNDPSLLSELEGYWAVVSLLSDKAVAQAEADGDVLSLVKFGNHGPHFPQQAGCDDGGSLQNPGTINKSRTKSLKSKKRIFANALDKRLKRHTSRIRPGPNLIWGSYWKRLKNKTGILPRIFFWKGYQRCRKQIRKSSKA